MERMARPSRCCPISRRLGRPRHAGTRLPGRRGATAAGGRAGMPGRLSAAAAGDRHRAVAPEHLLLREATALVEAGRRRHCEAAVDENHGHVLSSGAPSTSKIAFSYPWPWKPSARWNKGLPLSISSAMAQLRDQTSTYV